MAELLELRRIECRGTPQQMGRAHGETLRNEITAFIQGRREALRAYAARRGQDDVSGFEEAGARCLSLAKEWDPEGILEHVGIAEGAGVDPALLYAIANLSDLRDILLLSDAPEGEGCSMLLLPPGSTDGGQVIAAQTWDLGPRDLDFVVAVERYPSDGTRTVSLTCAGCLTLIGVNEHGLAVGTTNIKIRGAAPGVGYLSILHRMIRERTVGAASALLTGVKKAAAHTYWIATGDEATEWECGPTTGVERKLGDRPICRTNHCLSASLQAREGEVPTSSSRARLARLEALTAGATHGVESLRELFADRADGIDSISRFPEDGQPTATNAVVICLPAERRMWACRGPAVRGRFVELGFGEPRGPRLK